MKEKNGKTVPNCVPEGFEESEFPKGIFLKDYLKPETYGNAEDHIKDAQKHKSDYLNKSQDPKFGPNHEDTIKSKALWKWHNAQKHYHEGKSNSQSWYSSNMDEFEKLRRSHALLANEREKKSLTKEEYIPEKLEDIHGKVVGIDELSKHLNKTQLKNLTNHEWHKTYASYGDKPTAYRVSRHPTLENDFSVEAGHGQPRDKERFGDKEDVRHMVNFHFYKNKVHNADLFHNFGDQRHPKTGKKVWVWKRSHKGD